MFIFKIDLNDQRAGVSEAAMQRPVMMKDDISRFYESFRLIMERTIARN